MKKLFFMIFLLGCVSNAQHKWDAALPWYHGRVMPKLSNAETLLTKIGVVNDSMWIGKPSGFAKFKPLPSGLSMGFGEDKRSLEVTTGLTIVPGGSLHSASFTILGDTGSGSDISPGLVQMAWGFKRDSVYRLLLQEGFDFGEPTGAGKFPRTTWANDKLPVIYVLKGFFNKYSPQFHDHVVLAIDTLTHRTVAGLKYYPGQMGFGLTNPSYAYYHFNARNDMGNALTVQSDYAIMRINRSAYDSTNAFLDLTTGEHNSRAVVMQIGHTGNITWKAPGDNFDPFHVGGVGWGARIIFYDSLNNKMTFQAGRFNFVAGDSTNAMSVSAAGKTAAHLAIYSGYQSNKEAQLSLRPDSNGLSIIDADNQLWVGTRDSANLNLYTSATVRFTINENGQVILFNNVYRDSVQILGARQTGFTSLSGTADKSTSWNTESMTLGNLTRRVKALQDALEAHGLIGN